MGSRKDRKENAMDTAHEMTPFRLHGDHRVNDNSNILIYVYLR